MIVLLKLCTTLSFPRIRTSASASFFLHIRLPSFYLHLYRLVEGNPTNCMSGIGYVNFSQWGTSPAELVRSVQSGEPASVARVATQQEFENVWDYIKVCNFEGFVVIRNNEILNLLFIY